VFDSPLKQEVFLFSEMSLSARGPPSLLVDGYDESLSLEVKRRGLGINLLLPSRFVFTNEWSYRYTPLYMFMEFAGETSVIFCNCP